MEVKLQVTRTRGIPSSITKIVPATIVGTDTQVRRKAELDYLNEYINRDGYFHTFTDITQAKKSDWPENKITNNTMNPQDIINWGELSKLLTGSRMNIRRNRIPKKHQANVDILLGAVSKAIDTINQNKDKHYEREV